MTGVRAKQILLLLAFIPVAAMAQSPEVRPGKGLTIIAGDFAEYSNVEVRGEKTTQFPSTIMVAMGKVEAFDGVQVISVRGEALVSKRMVLYDSTREKRKQGELLETGTESLIIAGKKLECAWEKRRDQNVTATFWRSRELPFERYAKVQMEADDGRKMITTLVCHGPHGTDQEANMGFLMRIQKLSAQQDQPGSRRF